MIGMAASETSVALSVIAVTGPVTGIAVGTALLGFVALQATKVLFLSLT